MPTIYEFAHDVDKYNAFNNMYLLLSVILYVRYLYTQYIFLNGKNYDDDANSLPYVVCFVVATLLITFRNRNFIYGLLSYMFVTFIV